MSPPLRLIENEGLRSSSSRFSTSVIRFDSSAISASSDCSSREAS